MKFCFRILIVNFLLFAGLAIYGDTITLAVLDFENRSFMNADAYAALSQGLAEMMITELSRIESVKMVERRRMQEMLDELKMVQSGLISESTSIQVGKMLGAKNLVFGSYMVMPGDKIRIDLRIVEVETGSVVKAEETTGKTRQILSLIKKLSKKLLDDLSVRLTKSESKMLDSGKTLKIEAVVLFSEGLSFEDQNQLQKAYSQYKKALEIEPEFQQAKDAILRIAEKKRQME
ncbi:hypothetical protein JW835_13820 [bacterium]|nr:hypothetical protein [bacterium]